MKQWTVKYSPKTSSEVVGNEKEVQKLKSLIENPIKGKAILVCGAVGIGKTSSVDAIAKELEYDLLEINSSDTRNAKAIDEQLRKAIGQQSLLFRNKIILVDEVDGFSGVKDRGGIQALIKLLPKSSFPIVVTAKDLSDDKIKNLKKVSTVIEFNEIDYKELSKHLAKICEAENIEYEEDALNRLARSSGNDVRASINDLQSLSNKKITKETVETLSDRNREQTIINSLMQVFKTKDEKIAKNAFEDIKENVDELFLWMESNMIKEYTKIIDLANGFNVLSEADVYFGRIRRWQYYRYYVYIYDLLSVGIALAKEEKYPGFVKYSRNGRLLKMWWANQKNAKKKSIAEKLANKTHMSKSQLFKETIPYLSFIARNNPSKINAISEYYELEKEEVQYLMK